MSNEKSNILRHAVHVVLSTCMVAGTAEVLFWSHAAAAPPPNALPKPCFAGSCGSTPNGSPLVWVTGHQATAVSSGNTLTINQNVNSVLLNWQSFDVGQDSKVIFNQPSSTAIALNRIFQANPSQIFGAIQANGQIYLINQNGFMFGPSANVNVGGLLASSLNLDTDTFNAGILSAAAKLRPALDGTHYIDANGQPVAPGDIAIAAGAKIAANSANGRIMMAAPNINNAGTISAPDGQVALAAGDKLWVQASNDPKLRGLLVEVDGDGVATNQVGGSISANRGNVTMVGLAVNQDGRVSATTSTSANGSVRLLARNNVQASQGDNNAVNILASKGGSLELGSESVTSVLPDPTDKSTAVDDQLQLASTLELMGQHILFKGGSQIKAPSGQLTLVATADPSKVHIDPLKSNDDNITNNVDAGNVNDMIRVETGATIDLSGSVAAASVTRNLLTVELRANELADDPQQRNGPLRGQTVVVDARVQTPIANVSGAEALTQRDILERTSTGGSVTFNSGGDVSIASGAIINVSGGKVNYTPGFMQTSTLVRADGSTVNIGSANPNDTYQGVMQSTVVIVSDRFGYERRISAPGLAYYDPGYVQGADAGSISILAPTMILNGTLVGHATNGVFQRRGSTVAQGGSLSLGATSTGSARSFFAPAVTFSSTTPNIVFDETHPLPSTLSLLLPTDFIDNGGFSRVQIASDGSITVPSKVPLDLPAGGVLNLNASSINVGSNIDIAGGTIFLQSTTRQGAIGASASTTGISFGDGITLNVSGLFTNDSPAISNARAEGFNLYDAGSIRLNQTMDGGHLAFGANVSLTADGGAWLQQSGKVIGGKGGSIGILSNSIANTALEIGDNLAVEAFGVQGALGGSIAVTAPRIAIDSKGTNWVSPQVVNADPTSGTVLNLDTSLFSGHGFSAFNITANGVPLDKLNDANSLIILPGAQINLRPQTLLLTANAGAHSSTESVSDLTQASQLAAYLRTNSSQLILNTTLPSASPSTTQIGDLEFGIGASIAADPGSTVTMTSIGSIAFNGSVAVPTGNVNLKILTPPQSSGNAALFDPGYNPNQKLELGSTATIDVSGSTSAIVGTNAIYAPSDSGLLQGKVLAGGNVSLIAQRGSVVLDDKMDSGYTIDYSGTAAPIDLPVTLPASGTQRNVVASAGGSLTIEAPESISLGNFKVNGAAGQNGTTGAAPGGSLEVVLSRVVNFSASGNPFPSNARTIELTDPAAPPSIAQNGFALLNPTLIERSGIDALTLIADGAIQFDTNANMSLARSMVLQSPAIALQGNAAVLVQAPELQLGSGLISFPTFSDGLHGASATSGNGVFGAQADNVDLIGSLAFQGTSQVSLSSKGGINLFGGQNSSLNSSNSNSNNGNLDTASYLTLTASRVTPGTGVTYAINDAGSTVEFKQASAKAGVPLSVDGSLIVNADNIVQSGTLLAPFGNIELNAKDSLTLNALSTTSVSGAGATLPYGRVDSGTTWVYGLSDFTAAPLNGMPQKQIVLNGGSVAMAQGAVVDISGGGDLLSYGWTPGTGGSRDILDAQVSPALFAVLPALQNQFAPYDPLAYGTSSALTSGSSIYLSGGGGLAAGVYPLLPARYALLPGAFLVSAAPGVNTLQPGTSLKTADGAAIVSGKFTFGNSGLGTTLSSGFIVRPGSYVHQLADYSDVYASQFFAGAPTSTPWAQSIPADAGALTIAALNQLNASATVRGAAAMGGQGATIGLSAQNLQIDPVGTAPIAAKKVSITANVVNSWNAGRLVIGGSILPSGQLEVDADNVAVDAGSHLSADEILLTAKSSLSIAAGASVQSSSAVAGATKPSANTLSTPTSLSITGDNANDAVLLAVSDRYDFVPLRSDNGGSTGANITIATDAHVASRGALLIDAPGGATIADGSVVGNEARWSLGANQIAFGEDRTQANTLVIDSATVAAMNAGRSVRITARDGIDLQESLTLGTSTAGRLIDSIALSGSSLNAVDGVTASFSAATITLSNSGSNQLGANSPLTAGTGALNLSANEIDIGPGNQNINGVAHTSLLATNAVIGVGAGSLRVSGDLDITTNVIATQAGAATTIDAATGTVNLLAPTTAPTASVSRGFGGLLDIHAQTIVDGTALVLPSGIVKLNATQQLTLQKGAAIDVAGATVSFAPHGSDGGAIELRSGGEITMNTAATMTVAAVSGANAGRIDIVAGGDANLAGQIAGSSDANLSGGTFTVQAGSLTDFNSLNKTLEQNGFTSERDYEVRTGDLMLESGSTITAHSVVLTADKGSVIVSGDIDASGSVDRGFINLNALNDIDVKGNLTAMGLGPNGRGGAITLMTSQGSVNVEASATISAAGLGSTGQLLVRAPLDASIPSTPDIKVSLAGNVSKVDSIVVEPMLAKSLSANPSASDFDAIASDVQTAMSANAIAARLNPGNATNFVVRPYVDMSYDGDLLLPAYNLFAHWRFNNQPADVAFRASGNINLNGTLSDGFKINGTGRNSFLSLTGDSSSGIALIAGADFNAVAPDAILSNSNASLTLADTAVVRTGTGDLLLAAAGDVNVGAGAHIYTGGTIGVATSTAVARTTTYASGNNTIRIQAGRDIVATPVIQSVTSWQPRSGSPMASWGINFNTFGWTVGALGGGDVFLTARGSARDISAAVADNRFANGTAQLFGGGNLRVIAGEDITSGNFYVGRGTGTLIAGRAIASDRADGSKPIGTLVSVGDASFSLRARGDVLLQGEVQPTLLIDQTAKTSNYFSRYGSETALNVSSVGGDITWLPAATTAFQIGDEVINNSGDAPTIAAPHIELIAYSGDVNIAAPITASSSRTGQIVIGAARDMNVKGQGVQVTLADTDSTLVPTADSALGNSPADQADLVRSTLQSFHTTSIHSGDPAPVFIAAGRDINSLSLSLSKSATISAGRDVRDLRLVGQNVNSGDSTVIQAGRDIEFPTDTSLTTLSLSGPGNFDVIAGRNVDFGLSGGATTVGNFLNPTLPAGGASINVLAGLGRPLGIEKAPTTTTRDFLTEVITPVAGYQQELQTYVQSTTGESDLDYSQAALLFRGMTQAQQLALLSKIFFEELVTSGREANAKPLAGFVRGYAAIDTLLPGSRLADDAASPYVGDLSLVLSRIYSLDGGSINLLVPGGTLDVGLATARPPAYLLGNNTGFARLPSQLGIVAEKEGDVNIFTKGNVLVNSSRVFTLLGGNVAIWSTVGNIDAGRGAKSAVSSPPPIVTVDPAGNVTVDAGATVAGSGIRTINTDLSVKPGNVDLIAPAGFVNAGDAGIGASGNLNIAAQRVVGLDNIQVGGSSTGVPPATSGLGASLAGASQAANSATNSATSSVGGQDNAKDSAAPLAQTALSWLDVFVLGLGEDMCKQDDIECLKRQKTN